jgi:hypothetical protein
MIEDIKVIHALQIYGGIKDLLRSLSSSMSSNDQSRPLKYYYMNYGKEHRKIECHSCGSKMKKGRIRTVFTLCSIASWPYSSVRQ